MNDAMPVDMVHRQTSLIKICERFFHGKTTLGSKHLVKVSALTVLQNYVYVVGVLEGLINFDDVLMIQFALVVDLRLDIGLSVELSHLLLTDLHKGVVLPISSQNICSQSSLD